MDDNTTKLTVESLKLLQDWSKWLIALETLICANLWPKLTDKLNPSTALYIGWMMFWASIIAAAILLISISYFVRQADKKGESDLKKVKLLVAIEYAFFLGGLFCLAWRLAQVWLGL